jgi:hypothetical protein
MSAIGVFSGFTMPSGLPAATPPVGLAARHQDADHRHGACKQQPRHDDEQHAIRQQPSPAWVNPREFRHS